MTEYINKSIYRYNTCGKNLDSVFFKQLFRIYFHSRTFLFLFLFLSGAYPEPRETWKDVK